MAEGVKVIRPMLLAKIFKTLQRDARRRRQGFFRGRYLVAKDMSQDTSAISFILLQRAQASLLVVYPNTGKGDVTNEVFNLPPFLADTLKIIKDKGPLTSSKLAKLPRDKGGAARERLRQFHRRGLAERIAKGTLAVDRFFEYKAFEPEPKVSS